MRFKACSALLLAALLAGSLTACGTSTTAADTATKPNAAQATIDAAFSENGFGSDGDKAIVAETASLEETSSNEWFTDRDLKQTADLTGAVTYTVEGGKDIEITEAGVYVLTGAAENVTVTVTAGDDDKVQLVLYGVSITNEDAPCIYVKNADKVFITTTNSENSLSVTGTFTADGDTNTDAVIFSRDDIVLNGQGTLAIESTGNGVSSKDDLKVTGGALIIECASDALEANDTIAVAGGDLTIDAGKDGLNAGDDEEDGTGNVYLAGGTFTISAGSDGIQGNNTVRIDGGTLLLEAPEGIEGTYVQINDGSIAITATDDGINATQKSTAVNVAVEITGGDITIEMGQGDTDAIDVNGDLTISGGTVDITARSPFDYDGTGTLSGGAVTVNGEEITQLTNQMMGGGMGGFRQGSQPSLSEDGETPDFSGGGTWEGRQPRSDWNTDGDTGATPDEDNDFGGYGGRGRQSYGYDTVPWGYGYNDNGGYNYDSDYGYGTASDDASFL